MRTSVAWCLAFLSATGHHSSELVCTQSKSVSAMGVADEHSQLSIGFLSHPQKDPADKTDERRNREEVRYDKVDEEKSN